MRFEEGKGDIENLTGDVLIYSIYDEEFKSTEFSSINKDNSNYQSFDDGNAFGIYITNSIDNIKNKIPDCPSNYAFSHILECSGDEEFKKKILASYHGRELIITSKQFYFDSEQKLLKRFEGVNEIILPENFTTVSRCMHYNNINLDDYVTRFIYQKNNGLIINVQNKTYGEVSLEESLEIVTGYFNKMNQALVRGDEGEFTYVKTKLLEFSAGSPLINDIPKICDLFSKTNEKERNTIGSDVGLIMGATKGQTYEIAGNVKKRLTKRLTEIENALNENELTKILKSGRDKINPQQ